MEYFNDALLILVGFAAGFLNTVAGGGSLISLPVMIFMGLPGTIANATNRVAILIQNIFAVSGFHSKGVSLPFPFILYLSAASLVGGFIGASLATGIDDAVFNKVLAIIMVAVVLTIVLEPRKSLQPKVERLSSKYQVLGVLSFFLLGIYGGFVQAGIGFLVILSLSKINHFGLVKANYIKVFAAIIYTGTSVLVFALADKIDWRTGLVLAIGHGFGGWYASRWSVDHGDVWIKRVMVVAVIILAVKLWFFQ